MTPFGWLWLWFHHFLGLRKTLHNPFLQQIFQRLLRGLEMRRWRSLLPHLSSCVPQVAGNTTIAQLASAFL
jgi:hypothetical protein